MLENNDGLNDIKQLRLESESFENSKRIQKHRPRMPSVSLNFDDTDELFGGTFYKQQKVLLERQKIIQESQKNEIGGLETAKPLIDDSIDDNVTESATIVEKGCENNLNESQEKAISDDVDASYKQEAMARLSSMMHPLASGKELHRTVLSRRGSHTHQDEFSERMRTAAVMLAQLAQTSKKDVGKMVKAAPDSGGAKSVFIADEIREKIIKEMMALEEKRQLKIKVEGMSGVGGEGTGETLEDELIHVVKKDKDDPSGKVMGADFSCGISGELGNEAIKNSGIFPFWTSSKLEITFCHWFTLFG